MNENGVATDMAYIEPKQNEAYRDERPTGGKNRRLMVMSGYRP